MQAVAHAGQSPLFESGTIVLATLTNPREKFWGAILEISVAGAYLRGVELGSMDDVARILKDGEPATPSTVFFPMHRVERIEIDVPNGDIPSLCARFENSSGLAAETFLGVVG